MNLKILVIAAIASFPLMAIAQTQTPSTAAPQDTNAPVANTPEAHTSTTVKTDDGKTEQTPPVGMRSGAKNTGN